MAIDRSKKTALVSEMTEAMKDAKMTAFAAYQGVTVADLQQLRAFLHSEKLRLEASVAAQAARSD